MPWSWALEVALNDTLFRQAVFEGRALGGLGSVRGTGTIPLAWTTILATLFSLLLVSFAVFGQYTRKVRVSGMLQPAAGALAVVAPIPGQVIESRVKEADAVREGDILFVMSAERQSAVGETQEAISRQIESRRLSLESERVLLQRRGRERDIALVGRIAALDAEIGHVLREIDVQEARAELARSTLVRFQSLAASGFVSSLQAQQKQEEMLDQKGRVESLRRTRLDLVRERTTLAAQKDEMSRQLQLDLAQTDRSFALLDTEMAENEARRGVWIPAPKAGTVHAITLTPGQSALAGAQLATLLPTGTVLEAHLLAPSRAIGFVQSGQSVRIGYQAFPFQKYGLQNGTVSQVERTPISRDTGMAHANSAGADPHYRIVVSLASQTIGAAGESIPLKPGMALEADVVQERKRIYEWFLDPLLRMKRTLPI